MKGDGKGAADDLIYGLGPSVVRNAEVEMDSVPDVPDELLWQRFVEAVQGLQSLDIFGALLVTDVEGASRRGMHDQERECSHRQNGGDEPEDPVHGESQHAGFGLLTGVFADRGSDDAPGGQATRHPALADAEALRRPLTFTRPNNVVKVVSVHLMNEQRDDSIAQF